MILRTLLLLALSSCLIACSGDDTTADTGADASTTDTGADASSTDGSTPDTSTPDSSTPDTGTDTGGEDAEQPPAIPTPSICQEQCVVDEDCAAFGRTLDCVEGRCRLGGPQILGCADDNECVLALSGLRWAFDRPCTANSARDGSCAEGQECCGSGSSCLESGHCALSISNAGGCILDSQVLETRTGIDGVPVEVCVNPGTADAVCGEDGNCRNPCEVDAECPVDIIGADVCTAEGDCVCSETSCEGFAFGSACLGSGSCGCNSDADCGTDTRGKCWPGGYCGCETDADCPSDQPSASQCQMGFCGCPDSASCTRPPLYEGTTIVCE